MPVTATYVSEITIDETLADVFLSSSQKTVKHNGLNRTETLNAGSSVPATIGTAYRLTLSAGAATIDLRALPATNGGTLDGNGLKVQLVKFRNKPENANDITIVKGATNGYNLAGANFSVTLAPDQELTLYLDDKAPDVSGTAKTLDVTGTGSQILEVEFVLG